MLQAQSYYSEHGITEGGEGLRAAQYVAGILAALLTYVLPVFGSSHPMSVTVKCKVTGILFLWTIFHFLVIMLYQKLILEQFFNSDSDYTKIFYRTVGTFCIFFSMTQV